MRKELGQSPVGSATSPKGERAVNPRPSAARPLVPARLGPRSPAQFALPKTVGGCEPKSGMRGRLAGSATKTSPTAVIIGRMTIWAFGGPEGPKAEQLYQSLTAESKSRFGWSHRDEHNLLLENNWTPQHPRALFLLDVAPGDWIVHINVPKWGKCVAARVQSRYGFDDGAGSDFRHFFKIDPTTIVPFDRRDPAVVPTVNLRPRGRYQRIYAVEDFIRTLDNLKNERPATLGAKTLPHLQNVVRVIQEFHPGKSLEDFFADVLECVPGVKRVRRNGRRWGTDHGADLIVTMSQCLANMELEQLMVVQVKSWKEQARGLTAVHQLRTAFDKFGADAGMLVTTAEPTIELERAIGGLSDELGKPIELLAHTDLGKFVIKHAQHLLFP